MTDTNGGRPLPWQDTARCGSRKKDHMNPGRQYTCGGPMLPVSAFQEDGLRYNGPKGSRIACAACGDAVVGTPAEVEKTELAHRAYRAYEAGTVHPDKSCARCHGVLPLENVRLCPTCVPKDNAERQASLFPAL